MQSYITTTDLRTKSSKLVEILRGGQSISLIHRSKVIGKIEPFQEKTILFNAQTFEQLAEKLNLPKTTYAQREKRYKAHLMKKYGKNLR